MLFRNPILYYFFCFLSYCANAYSFNGIPTLSPTAQISTLYLGFQIRDLEKNGTEFLIEAQSWFASALQSSPIITYTCNDTTLVGGYGILGTGSGGTQNQYYKRIYTGLPAHNTIYYTISFWLLDSWDNGIDYFQWSFDSIVITGWGPGYSSFKTQLCGWTSYKDLSNLRTFGKVSHSASTLKLKVISQLDQDSLDESIAIRDINILLLNTSLAAGTSQFCGKSTDITLSSNQCSCPEGHSFGSGTCATCDVSCSSCFGPSNRECYQCASGYSWNGTNCIPCNANCSVCYGTGANQCSTCKSGYYLFQNNTCLSSCDTPFVITSSGSTYYCSKPCSGSLFYYNNGSCLANCSSPFVQQVYQSTNFCINPCSTSQYLYSNGSCLSTCRQYFIASIDAGGKYCNYPCLGSQFLYWNGSCLNTCSSPFVSSIGTNGQYCDFPCENSTDYLYQNLSCLPSCPSPFLAKISPCAQYCNSPCLVNEYYYSNSSCGASCPSPYIVRTESIMKYCDFPCLESEYYYQNTSCLGSCPSPYIASADTNGKYCSFPCANPGDFYWQNGSCLGVCDSLFVMRADPMGDYCDFPCSSSEYFYQNSSCLAGCDSPYVVRTDSMGSYCDFPCSSSEYLALWSNSCINSCNSPLISSSDPMGKYCEFPCLSSEYLYENNGSCLSSCNSPAIAIVKPEGNYCKTICASNKYLYWDGSCLPSCDFPLIQSIQGSLKTCQYSCQDDGFLYWDGTCNSHCPAPLTTRTEGNPPKQFCDYGCNSNAFLYWDGACLNDCEAPLSSSTYKNRSFCQHPCDDTSDFIYWNSSCDSSCPAPLNSRIGTRVKYCDPACLGDDSYLYWNGSCLDTCSFPLSIWVDSENEVKYCEYPCQSSGEYLYWDGTCLSSCNYPLIPAQEGQKFFCQLPCNPSEFFNTVTGKCQANCSQPYVIHQYADPAGFLTCEISSYSLTRATTEDNDTVLEIIQVTEPKTFTESAHETTSSILKNGMLVDMLFSTHSDPNVLVVMMIIKVLKYIQFLDIEFPEKLQDLLDNSNEEPIIMNFGPPLSKKLSKRFPEHEVPHIFEKNEFHASFLVNYFKKITTLCIVFGIGIFVSFLERLTPKIKNKYLKAIIERLGKFLRWNLIFMIIIESMDEVILFTSLEWKTNGFESFLECFSFLICLVTFIGGISVVLAPIYILRKMNKAKMLAHSHQDYNHYLDFLEKWRGYQVLWKEFRDDTLSRQAFLSAFLGRTVLVYIVACWLYHHPLVQTILYTLISGLLISYLCYVQPFKKRINFLQALTYEIVIITINVLVMILAIFDQGHASAEQVRLFIADVVVFLLMSLSMISLGFILAKAVKKVKNFLKWYKNRPRPARIRPLKHKAKAPFTRKIFDFDESRVEETSGTSSNVQLMTGKQGMKFIQTKVSGFQDPLTSPSNKILFSEDDQTLKFQKLLSATSPKEESLVQREIPAVTLGPTDSESDAERSAMNNLSLVKHASTEGEVSYKAMLSAKKTMFSINKSLQNSSDSDSDMMSTSKKHKHTFNFEREAEIDDIFGLRLEETGIQPGSKISKALNIRNAFKLQLEDRSDSEPPAKLRISKSQKSVFNKSQNSGLQSIPDKPEEESFVSDFSFNKNQRRNMTEIDMKEPDDFSLSAQRARAEKEEYKEKRRSMIVNSAGLKKKDVSLKITRNSLNSAGLKKKDKSFEVTENSQGDGDQIENIKLETEQAEEEIPRNNNKVPFMLKSEMIARLKVMIAKKKRSSIEASQNESSGSNLTPADSAASNKIMVTLDKKMLSKFASHQHVRKLSYDTLSSFDMNLMLNTPQRSSLLLSSEVHSGVMDNFGGEEKRIDEEEESEIENNFFEGNQDDGGKLNKETNE